MAKLEVRHIPGGDSVFLTDPESQTEATWYVDSVNGTNDAGHGKLPGTGALASLAYLITNATTLGLAAGDNIELAASHNENIANAQISISTAGLHIYGHKEAAGDRRPRFDYDHANAEITLNADNIHLENVVLLPSVTGVLIGIELPSGVTGCTLNNIEWASGEDGSGTDEFVKALVLTSGNNDTVMRDLKILSHASAAGSTHGIHVAAAANRLTFDSVLIDGPYATGGIVEAAAGLNHVCVGCSVDVTGTNYSFHASSTFAKRYGNLDAGAPTDAADNLIGFNNNDNAVSTANVAANDDGSVLEREEAIKDYVKQLFSVAAGTGVYPSGVVDDTAWAMLLSKSNPASASSYDNQTDSLEAISDQAQKIDLVTMGTVAAGSLAACMERCVEKTGVTCENNTTDDMFTISGGPVYGMLTLINTVAVGGATNAKLQMTTTSPAATVDLSTAVAVGALVGGGSIRFVGAAGVLTPDANGAVIVDPVTVADCWFLLPAGTLKFHSSAAQAAARFTAYLRFKPLSPNSLVVAAA